VADNPCKDFLGARQAGIWTVRVRRPDGLYSHLDPVSAQYAPDVEIESLDGLEAILQGIGEEM
jgi:FMN phosphatase YigB (HAD superfamily)